MNTKLTLTIEQRTIEKAKKYAKEQGRSLSDIVQTYLHALTSKEEDDESEITPLVKSLRGSFKVPEDFDYKEELAKILAEKYLRDE
jgi:hypothetical protein